MHIIVRSVGRLVHRCTGKMEEDPNSSTYSGTRNAGRFTSAGRHPLMRDVEPFRFITEIAWFF
jgi:hypothetical protein